MIMEMLLSGLGRKIVHPAPTTTVKRCKSNDTHSDSSQGDSIALWIVAIVAIVISLIALLNKRIQKFN